MQFTVGSIFKSFAIGLLAGALWLPAAEPDAQVPKELLEYVRSAQKAGMKPPEIVEMVVKRGWSESMAKSAVEAVVQSGRPESGKAAPGGAASAQPTPPKTIPAAPEAGETASTLAPTSTEPATPTASPVPATAGPAPKGSAPKASAPGSDVPYDYEIGEGDVLQVSVFGEPSVSVGSVVVRPDGKISIPLLGDIVAAGLTPTQLSTVVSGKLTDLIKTADVTVVVNQINSKKIYLIGAVKKEGPLPYTYRMTIMQALSEAGGLTDYAKRKKIYVLRNRNGRRSQFPFDYDAVLRGEHTELNVELLPGDTLVVPH